MKAIKFFSPLLYFVCASLSAAPTILLVSPSNGAVAGGNAVTLTGTGFTAASAVNFGGIPATSYTVYSDNTISAIVPAGTPGNVDISVTAANENSNLNPLDFYTYTQAGWNGIISGSNPHAISTFNTDSKTFENAAFLPHPSLASVVTPNGKTIYAADYDQQNVTVIDAAINAIVANIPTNSGAGSFDIVVSPDGARVYVSNNLTGYLTAIDTASNTVVKEIFVADNLGHLAITADGSTLYVSSMTTASVTPIDTAAMEAGAAIYTGMAPAMISITADGSTAYVANTESDTVSVIDLAAKMVTFNIVFPKGSGPYGSTILPNGQLMFVTNTNNGTFSVIDLATNALTGTYPLAEGTRPKHVVSAPDSKTVYILSQNSNDVTPVDVATREIASPIEIDGEVLDLVLSPDQAPVANFLITAAPSGVPTIFDASNSLSPVGSIATYFWDFGDGATLTTATPVVDHAYSTANNYKAQLTVTNSAGTSTAKLFSSRSMSHNGGETAMTTQELNIAPSAPANFQGFQKKSRFLIFTDYSNTLNWTHPTVGHAPASYKIYRDAELTDHLATISGSSSLTYQDCKRKKNKAYTYYLVSVSENGTESAPVSLTIDPV